MKKNFYAAVILAVTLMLVFHFSLMVAVAADLRVTDSKGVIHELNDVYINYPAMGPSREKEGIVVVINNSDIIDGDTSNFDNLIKNPGPDGISFREAVIASNNTPGPKRINFAPSLIGAKITFAANGDILLLSSGDLTIDGDINGDGIPDITLDGSLGTDNTPSGPGLNIWSSNNTIKGLTFDQFAGPSIQTAIPSQDPTVKTITGNKILGNSIFSTRSGLMAIKVGQMGLLEVSAYTGVTDIHIQDTVIAGNRIAHLNGIVIIAGEGGSSWNKITNVIIAGNDITGQEVGLAFMAGDAATDYFGLPEPIYYSDDNTLENVIILNNRIGAELYYAISIAVANYGNRRNRIVNTKIIGNTITNAGQGGIYL